MKRIPVVLFLTLALTFIPLFAPNALATDTPADPTPDTIHQTPDTADDPEPQLPPEDTGGAAEDLSEPLNPEFFDSLDFLYIRRQGDTSYLDYEVTPTVDPDTGEISVYDATDTAAPADLFWEREHIDLSPGESYTIKIQYHCRLSDFPDYRFWLRLSPPHSDSTELTATLILTEPDGETIVARAVDTVTTTVTAPFRIGSYNGWINLHDLTTASSSLSNYISSEGIFGEDDKFAMEITPTRTDRGILIFNFSLQDPTEPIIPPIVALHDELFPESMRIYDPESGFHAPETPHASVEPTIPNATPTPESRPSKLYYLPILIALFLVAFVGVLYHRHLAEEQDRRDHLREVRREARLRAEANEATLISVENALLFARPRRPALTAGDSESDEDVDPADTGADPSAVVALLAEGTTEPVVIVDDPTDHATTVDTEATDASLTEDDSAL